MAMGPGRFMNVFERLSVELERMRRIGVPDKVIVDIKEQLLRFKPKNGDEYTTPAVRKGPPTTPYALAVNRLEAYKRDELTWSYFLKAWEECSPEDQARLNELIEEMNNA